MYHDNSTHTAATENLKHQQAALSHPVVLLALHWRTPAVLILLFDPRLVRFYSQSSRPCPSTSRPPRLVQQPDHRTSKTKKKITRPTICSASFLYLRFLSCESLELLLSLPLLATVFLFVLRFCVARASLRAPPPPSLSLPLSLRGGCATREVFGGQVAEKASARSYFSTTLSFSKKVAGEGFSLVRIQGGRGTIRKKRLGAHPPIEEQYWTARRSK